MANAWHVYRGVGIEKLHQAGGAHGVMNWNGLLCTDSGGYQVFSLRESSYLTDDGVVFGSGEDETLTPKNVIQMQKELGSDIMMALDDCAPFPCSKERALEAVRRTSLWGHKSIEIQAQIAPKYNYSQQLYGIVQGSTFEDLRIQSAEEAAALDFDGYGIGGLSIGMLRSMVREMTVLTCAHLPFSKPRHLLGVGLPIQVLQGVADGADTFDCVLPILKAQRGITYTAFGEVYYKSKQRGKLKDAPLDRKCKCSTCKSYSREQLRILYRTECNTAVELAAIHNLYFYHKMLEGAREAIRQDRFPNYLNDYISRWKAGGGTMPP